MGIHKEQYTGDGWTVNVSHPVIEKPLYTVELEYGGWSVYKNTDTEFFELLSI